MNIAGLSDLFKEMLFKAMPTDKKEIFGNLFVLKTESD